MNEPQDKTLFRPSVAPGRRGGLLLIGYDGSSLTIPDGEVEALIADMEAVRKRQLIRDCNRIAQQCRESIPSKLSAELDLAIRPAINGYEICQNGSNVFFDDDQVEALFEMHDRLQLLGGANG